MLARTFTFWRRLVGRPTETVEAPTGTAEDDRRVWVRYPADLEASLQPAGTGEFGRFAARIRDISRGGANLVVNRAFQPGDLLSLELPILENEGGASVLACVVRVNQADGEWALGCIFSRELSDEDLQRFGAKRQKHSPSDQRTWVRFPCTVRASYQHVGTADNESHPAEVLNISASGVGLLVSQPVETGTIMTVELLPAAGTTGRTMLACVVHATTREPGHWDLGCNFIRELTEEDLQALLAS